MKRSYCFLLFFYFCAASSAAANDTDSTESVFKKISPVVYSGESIDAFMTSMLIFQDAMSLGDWFLTKKALQMGAREGNPVMRWAFENPPADIGLKLISISLSNYFQKEVFKRDKTLGYITSVVFTAIHSAVLYHNIKIVIQI